MCKYSTRTYPYKKNLSLSNKNLGTENISLEGKVFSFILGLDSEPFGRAMSEEEIVALGDPFARLILSADLPALTLHDILQSSSLNEELPIQDLFMIAEGGQIRWSENKLLDRGLRVVVTKATKAKQTNLMISTTHPFNNADDTVFLQVIGWDEASGVFNFYERRLGKWFWAGNSWHSLDDRTRGKGPFDSHINGSVVMKELRAPWIYWHSQAQSIPFENFGPNNSFEKEPLLKNRSNAEKLEQSVIVPSIERWTRRRLTKLLEDPNKIIQVKSLMRQILTTTSYNLFSSKTEFSSIDNEAVFDIPIEFFIDKEALNTILKIKLNIQTIKCNTKDYKKILEKYDVSLVDEEQDFIQRGDSIFPFLAPCRSFEDNIILRELKNKKLISDHFAASLMMIDFCNPVLSIKRLSLMKYIPDEVIVLEDQEFPIEKSIMAKISCSPIDEVTKELMKNMSLSNWQEDFSERIIKYLDKITNNIKTEVGLEKYFQLLESRRSNFKKQPLSEFDLTIPRSNISTTIGNLIMTYEGDVVDLNIN